MLKKKIEEEAEELLREESLRQNLRKEMNRKSVLLR